MNEHAERIRRTMDNAYGRALKDREMMIINKNADALRVALITERARVKELEDFIRSKQMGEHINKMYKRTGY